MTSAIARCLAATAALAVLGTVAACGGGGSGRQTSPDTADTAHGWTEENGTEQSETGTTSTAEADGEIFPGSDSEEPSASAIKLPKTEVGEPARGEVEIKRSGEQPPKPLQDVRGSIGAEELEIIQNCLGEVPPGGCEVIFEHTPTTPGPYTGELVVTMTDGSTVTATIYGEAADASTSTADPTTTVPETPSVPTTPVVPTTTVPTTGPPTSTDVETLTP